MKLLKILFTALAAVLLFSTCEQSDTVEPEIQEELTEFVFFEENNHLQGLVNQVGSSSNGRTNSPLDDVDFDRAVKRLNPETGNTHYSFSMNSENGLAMRKFILTENQEGAVAGHVFEYEVNAEWYVLQDSFPGWDKYNGYFRILDLDGIVISEDYIAHDANNNEIKTIVAQMEDLLIRVVTLKQRKFAAHIPQQVNGFAGMKQQFIAIYQD